MKTAQVTGLLHRLPLFEGLGEKAVAELAKAADVERAPAGQVVLREGEEGDAMYVIASGRVRVEKRTHHQDSYTVTFLEGDEAGFFGELALLDREHRSATVTAESDCELLVIRRDRFLAFGDRHPEAGLVVTRRIARHLAERLRHTNRDLVTLFAALVQEIEERF